ncbi:MAG: hypothetical protein KJT03_18275, partial [Verrucomicrobiae bacterium]|nr:hypothetical protein [Verrucomicrobiae bacterium]
MNIRFKLRFLFSICVAGLAPWILNAAGPVDDPPPPLVKNAEHITLHNEGYSHNFRFYRLDDGTWYIRFNTQVTTSHMDQRHPELLAVVSRDDGRTWQSTDRWEENPNYRSKNGRMVEVGAHSWRTDVPERRLFYEAKGLEV